MRTLAAQANCHYDTGVSVVPCLSGSEYPVQMQPLISLSKPLMRCFIFSYLFMLPAIVFGQAPNSATDLVVEGIVKDVFRSDSQVLVQISTRNVALPNGAIQAGADYPAPGQNAYVHVSGSLMAARLPTAGAQVRAMLTLGQDGQWQASGQDWYSQDPTGSLAGSNSPPSGGDRAVLGVSTEKVSLGRQNGLKIILVVPDSPAARAGLEPGDVLVAVNGVALNSGEQLAAAFQNAGRQLTLTVRNVRDGRDVDVPVEGPGASGAIRPGSAQMTNRAPRALGVESETAFFNASPVLKVTQVQPGSPAAQSGIRVGMLIVKAAGRPVEKPEDLERLVQSSRGRLELTLVDPNDRQEQRVQVEL